MDYSKISDLPLRMDLKEYLYGRQETGVLLLGQKGMNMKKDAEVLASFLLSGEPKMSPDYLFIGLDEKATSIGAEQAEQILERAAYRPANAKRNVILIDDMDRMTVAAQNRLLKVLEDSTTTLIIGVAYEDTLLATVKSRMQVFTYVPLDYETFREFCSEKDIPDPEIMYFISGGKVDELDVSNPVIPTFRDVKKAIEGKELSALLPALGLLKEKDKENFFLSYPQYTGSLISFIGQLFVDKCKDYPDFLDYVTVCGKHRERCNSVSYTKDDFFSFIAQIIWKGAA